ncbi:MAG: hypothetical protein MR270_00485 [Erysipelotrichaceae bacterium]|nr:hypothetical protein [Erysipelotrichaceae bacterium]
MKKINTFLKTTILGILAFLMVFSVTFDFKNAKGALNVKAVSTSKVYTTDFYTLSYEDNEVKLLLNPSVSVYDNITKEDFVTFKNNVVSIAYEAILDDLNFNTSSSSTSSVRARRNAANPLVGQEIDISSVTSLISSQLVDLDSIDEALSENGKYDVLVQYYVDRYVDNYVAANPEADADAVFAEVSSTLTDSIQNVVNDVYASEGITTVPDVSLKIDAVLEDVANGASVSISLSDVTDIAKSVTSSQQITDIINDIDVKSEIKDIVTNSGADEIKDFFISVDMGVIADVFNSVEISNQDTKDIINSVGADTFIDIVDTVGIDNFKELAEAINFTKSDLEEVIKDNVSNVSLSSFVQMLKSLKVNGNALYENNSFVMDGFVSFIKSLPKPSEIAELSDAEMNWSWTVEAVTTFGTVGFDLVLGFDGDCSKIRAVAREIANVVDFDYADGVYNVTLNVPERLDNVVTRIANSSAVSDNLKHFAFDSLSSTVDELYNKFTNKTFESYLETLKSIDYQMIVQNLYNAENLNRLFGTDYFTDAKLDAFVDDVMRLVSKASNLTYDNIKNFVSRYVDISALDGTAVETLVNKATNVLKEIDALAIDSSLLREFIDPNSQYTNENIYNYIDKLERYEHYFNRVMDYVAKLYEAAPDRIKDNTMMDFYRGNGSFNYSGTINLDFEKILTTLSSRYGETIYTALSTVFDRLPTSVSVSLTAKLTDFYGVTYHYENGTKQGILAEGMDLDYFANVSEEIYGWVDANGDIYTTMPSRDIELYAIYDFDVVASEGVNKVYDGQESNIFVTPTVSLEGYDYSYQWYKDDVAIANAINSSYTVTNVADSGIYYCVVSVDSYGIVKKSDDIEVIISPKEVSITDVTWDYTNPFTYDGTEKTVKLLNVPEEVNVAYTDNVKTDAGAYTANAVVTLKDEFASNYVLVGNVDDLSWIINKAEVSLADVSWNYTAPFTYDGTEKTVTLVNVPEKANVTYTDNVKTDAGTYTASVVITLKDEFASNYVLVGSVDDLSWKINKAEVSLADVSWDYTAPFTYDGTEKTVTLVNVPEKVNVTYTDNAKTDAGTYTANAAITLKDEFASNYVLVGNVDDLSWKINKAEVSLADVSWDYTNPFIYDGTEKTVTVVNVPEKANVTYTDNVKTDAGTYTATAAITLKDEFASNYVLVGSVDDLSWIINKAEVSLADVSWDYTNPFIYNGTENTVTLVNVPEKANVTYTNNAKTNAGTYTANAVITLKDEFASNYVLVGSVGDLSWKINKQVIELSNLVWDYSNPIEYTGSEISVVFTTDSLLNVLSIRYIGNVEIDAGTYTARAVVTLTDEANYELSGSVDTLSWTISKKAVNVSTLQWNYTNPFPYDGKEHVVTLIDVPTTLDAHYTGNRAYNAGTYTATVSFTTKDNNHEVVGEVEDLQWKIIDETNPEVIDIFEKITTTYTEPFTYNGLQQGITINNTYPTALRITLSGTQYATDAGEYKVVVTVTVNSNIYELKDGIDTIEFNWTINPQTIDVSNVTWDYTEPFTYNGSERSVSLVNVPSHVVVHLNGDQAKTNAGTYTVTATLNAENANYVLSGQMAQPELVWTINPVQIDLANVRWNYTEPFKYDGQKHTVSLVNVPGHVLYEINGISSAKAAGIYTIKSVAFRTDNANYELINVPTLTLTWSIIDDTPQPPVIVGSFELVDGSTGAVIGVIEAEEGLPEGYSATASVVATPNVDLTTVFENGGTFVVVYNIVFYDENGNAISIPANSRGSFTVKLLIPEDKRAAELTLNVVYIADDGAITKMDATRDGNYMVFETNHFSKYAIVEVANKVEKSSTPWWLWVIIAALIIALIVVILLVSKKGPKEEVSEVKHLEQVTYLVCDESTQEVSEVSIKEYEESDILSETQSDNKVALGKVVADEKGLVVSIFKDYRKVKQVVGKDVNDTESIVYKDTKDVVSKD